MRIRALMAAKVTAVILFLISCSQGQVPTAPEYDIAAVTPNIQNVQNDATTSGHALLGYWNITVDPDTRTYEIVPMRQSEVHLNVLTWLENGPCFDCLKITKFTVPGNKLMDVEITFKHPFSDPKFTGFDVRGIVMFKGSLEFPTFGEKVSDLLKGDPMLLNPDGFTGLYNPSTAGNGTQGYLKGKLAPGFASPDATVNAYLTYFSNTNRRYFQAGTSIARTFEIQHPGGAFTFGYAVDASWAAPSTPITVPDSFPTNANSAEAYKVEVSATAPLAITAGAKTDVIIDVYDWQGASTVTGAKLESPLLWDGIIDATVDTGGPATKRFKAQVVNEFGFVPQGNYPILVQVLDSTSNPDALIDNIAWQIYNISLIVNHPPTCSADVSTFDPEPSEMVTFTDTSTDPQGQSDIVESWWDWNNDGTWDEQGFEVQHSFPSMGVYLVNHKVIDNAGAEDALNDPLTIDVGLLVTLAEDKARKKAGTGYHYKVYEGSYSSGSLIDLDDPDGPWDFTALTLSGSSNWMRIIDRNNSEVASFVNDFNAATTHFVKFQEFYDPFFTVIYEAQYHNFAADKLYIYGFHDPALIGSAKFGPPDTDEYLALPFPLTTATAYNFDVDKPGFNLDYHVKVIGSGNVTVPYGDGSTYNCLLVRYKFNVSSTPPLNGGTINFAFVADNGTVVANVIAVNKPPVYNFNPTTNKINGTGQALFQALDQIQ